MKKKTLLLVFVAILLSTGAIFTTYCASKQNSSSFIVTNLEALLDGESRIGIGGVCAYDLKSWCIYYDPYEEYPGTLVADPIIGPWQ